MSAGKEHDKERMEIVIEAIRNERLRQVHVEGWTPEHDDAHRKEDLASAAACYALPEWQRRIIGEDNIKWPWPWERSWWKPKDRRRDLIRAAALIVAEIERIDRP